MNAKISNIIEETLTISSFQLTPEADFDYLPGQWMDVRLPSGSSHSFTISSSPSETFVQFTTMFHEESAFKNELWNLGIGTQIEILGPNGHFVFAPTSSVPLLFLAGGIGMTPFRSMLKFVADAGIQRDIFAIQSAKDSGLILFDELPVQRVITSVDGRLNAEKIKQLCPDFMKREWWICGSAGFVDAMKEMATALGVTDAQIRTEDFPGY